MPGAAGPLHSALALAARLEGLSQARAQAAAIEQRAAALAQKASEANGKLVEKAESIYMGEVDYFTAGKKAKK